MSNVLCTLELSKKKFPGSKNNLNALCRRFNISLASREKHGALTDCYLLLRVYIELMGGKQENLLFSQGTKVFTETKKIDFSNREKIFIDIKEEEKSCIKKCLENTNPIWNL